MKNVYALMIFVFVGVSGCSGSTKDEVAQAEQKKVRGEHDKLKKLANEGDVNAQCELASKYVSTRKYEEAIKWWRKAAEQGHLKAQDLLSYHLAKGKMVQQDYAEAAKWNRIMSYQGYAAGMRRLGLAYEKGRGVPQSYEEAFVWFTAQQTFGDATYKKWAVEDLRDISKHLAPEQILKSKNRAKDLVMEIKAQATTRKDLE